MSNTLLLLTRYYSNVMRVESARIGAADQARLTTLAGQVDAGTTTYAAAQQSVASLAINTTSVANLSYNFFTGLTPTSGGLDYLVSPTGDNPNNLNSAYYQNFNLENRYINFAVNLGKLGEGQTKFTAEYGSLTLEQAVVKAYKEIFGIEKAGIEGILTADVGGQTRAQYFAYYGKDGPSGIGTKAAMVGWLLAEAAKADTGTYAQAESRFLADLGPDRLAAFNINIVATYGDQGGTSAAVPPISFLQTQSVTPTANDPALRSGGGHDTISGPALDAGQSVVAGGGFDKVTITGVVGGVIDTGDGNDIVTIGSLNAPVSILGGAETGVIRLGAGNDVLTITDRLAYGAIIDGGPGDDTLIAKFGNWDSPAPVVRNVEHLVVTGMGSVNVGLFFEQASFQDVTVRASGNISLGVGENVPITLQNAVTGNGVNGAYNFFIEGQAIRGPTGRIVTTPADYADLTVDNTSIVGNFSTNYVTVSGVAKTLRVHVLNDSSLGTLNVLGADGGGSPTVVIDGPGKLTTGITNSQFDASGVAAINVTAFRGAKAILSPGNDTIEVTLTSAGMSDYTLGAGSDTFRLAQEFSDFLNLKISTWFNLHVTGQTIDGYARILDFAKGVDHVDLGSYTTSVVTGLSIGSATTLEAALINISVNTPAKGTSIFEFGGDTYIYRQDDTIGVNGSLGSGPTTGDGLIKLVGVTGLSVGTGAAQVDIHYG